VVFIRCYRYPVGKWLTELPRGYGEVNASAIETARRELLEETGHQAEAMKDLGTVYPNTGNSSGSVKVFLAEGLSLVKRPDWDAEAIKELCEFKEDEWRRALNVGEIADGISMAALLLASERLAQWRKP
jgi:ADP-ribose pyrophosphatase